MARTNSVRVGLIGCGHVAETVHLPALRRASGVELVAAADIDPSRLRLIADRFDIPHRHASFAELVRNADVEAVVVCVPPAHHVEVGLAVLNAGKHLLIEKPLALSLEGCDRLIDGATRSPRVSMVGFNLRWHRLVQKAHRMIREGRLGTIKAVHGVVAVGTQYSGSALQWRQEGKLGGGALVDMAVHHFDLWRFLLGSEVEEVSAMTPPPEERDEPAVAMARMANGALACSSLARDTGTAHEIVILGSAGVLQLSCLRFDGLHWSPIASRPGTLRTRIGRLAHGLKELPHLALRRSRKGEYGASFRREWQHFIDCIRNGTAPGCTFADGRRATQVMLAAMESARLGRSVKVADAPRDFPGGRGTA